MKITGQDISMIRGDSESITVTCSDSSGVSIPFVEGDTVYFTVKENMFETEKAFQKVVTGFSDGKAIISILPADTKNLSFKSYVYDIQVTRYDGVVTTLVPASNFTIEGEVTYE